MLVRKYADTIGYLYETWNGYTCEELANIKLQKSNPYGEQWVATKIESGDRGSDHLIVRKNRQTYMPLYEIIPLSSYPSEIQDLCR